MFKKIDKFVFAMGVLSWVSIFVLSFTAIFTKNIEISKAVVFVPYFFGVPIFIKFLRDEDYKVLYYFLYCLCNTLNTKVFEFASNCFYSTGMFISIILLFFLVIVSPFISGYLFEFFKQKSYKRYKNIL